MPKLSETHKVFNVQGARKSVNDNGDTVVTSLGSLVRPDEGGIHSEFVGDDRPLLVSIKDIEEITFPKAVGGDDTFVIEQNGLYYRVHSFTTVGESSLEVTQGGEVDVLVVAGGGAGANGGVNTDTAGGGGGAGGLVFRKNYFVSKSSLSLVVGSGGSGTTGENRGESGEDSEFGDPENGGIKAIGGGGGGRYNVAPSDGGSGGGAGARNSEPEGDKGKAEQPNSDWGGFGNDGGERTSGAFSSNSGAAGGGGAGSSGGDAIDSGNGQPGGEGRDYSNIFGEGHGDDGFFAGGGAGGFGVGSVGFGGKGGGGDTNNSGFPNTGGGGGGRQADSSVAGGAGGSGIVIVRYRITQAEYNAEI